MRFGENGDRIWLLGLGAIVLAGAVRDGQYLFSSASPFGPNGYELPAGAPGLPWAGYAIHLVLVGLRHLGWGQIGAQKIVTIVLEGALAAGVFRLVERLSGTVSAGLCAAACLALADARGALQFDRPLELLALTLMVWALATKHWQWRCGLLAVATSAGVVAWGPIGLVVAAGAFCGYLSERFGDWRVVLALGAVWGIPLYLARIRPEIFSSVPAWPAGPVGLTAKAGMAVLALTFLGYTTIQSPVARPDRIPTAAAFAALLFGLNPFLRYEIAGDSFTGNLDALVPCLIAILAGCTVAALWKHWKWWAVTAVIGVAWVAGRGPLSVADQPAALSARAEFVASISAIRAAIPTGSVIAPRGPEAAMVAFALDLPVRDRANAFVLVRNVPGPIADPRMILVRVAPTGAATVLSPMDAMQSVLAAAPVSAKIAVISANQWLGGR